MVEEGQKVVMRGSFEANPDPSVLWFHNQKPIRPSHDVKIEVGDKETSISFNKIKSHQTGQYSCRLNNCGGTAESTTDLIVKRKELSPVFLKRLQSICENAGAKIIAEVEVGGTPNPDVLWLKDGVVIMNKPGHIKIHSNGPCHTLIIANLKVMLSLIHI